MPDFGIFDFAFLDLGRRRAAKISKPLCSKFANMCFLIARGESCECFLGKTENRQNRIVGQIRYEIRNQCEMKIDPFLFLKSDFRYVNIVFVYVAQVVCLSQ